MGVVLPSVLRLRLIVAALRLAVAIRSGLRHAERSSANAQILASRGVLRDGLAVIVVIVVEGGFELIEKINNEGYEWVKKELGIELQKEDEDVVSIGVCGHKVTSNV